MGRLGISVLMCSLLAAGQNAPPTGNAAPASVTSKKTTTASKNVKAEAATVKAPEGMTRDQADAILSELKAIHQLLITQGAKSYPPTPANALTIAPTPVPPTSDKVQMKLASGWHWMGRDDAPITLVEFTDYQCPFCRRYHTETFVQLKKNYIDTGKVRFVSRDLPLSFHSNAEKAAEAAWCAGEQNKYWELRDSMINSSDLSQDAIVKYAQNDGLNVDSLKSCMQSEKYKPEVQKDIADAGTLGISATPSFVIGKTGKDILDGERVVGAVPASVFESDIQKLLTAKP